MEKSMSGRLSKYSPETWRRLRTAISSQASAAGRSPCASPNGRTSDPYGLEAVLASLSAPPVSALDLKTIDICGPNSCASSRSAALQASLASRLRRSLEGLGSPVYALTWKEWSMLSGPPISALRASGRRISGNDSGGWPTPAAQEAGGTAEQFLARKEKAAANGAELGISLTSLSLVAQTAGWPSPASKDSHAGTEDNKTAQTGMNLRTVSGWASPALADARRSAFVDPEKRTKDGRGGQLPDQASGATPNGSPAPTASRGQLNPAHSRWLMGFPPEWDACAPTAMRSIRTARRKS